MDPFLDPKIDPKSIDFGTSKRYLKWTSKWNHFGVHFGVHFLGPSIPNRGQYIAYVSDSALLLVPPFTEIYTFAYIKKWVHFGSLI